MNPPGSSEGPGWDGAGNPLYFDFRADGVLRAIMEACKKANIDAKRIKMYESFAKADKQEGISALSGIR